jgi:AcrR family transcriptional regulator
MSSLRKPYLRAAERRRQLLDAAWSCALREGLGAITMAGVAREAAVSRQLLYTYFDGLPALVRELLLDRFGARRDQVGEAIARYPDRGERPVLVAARLYLTLPAAERALFQSFLSLALLPAHPLGALARELRSQMIARWSALVDGASERRTRALVWALINALFGLGELVDAGELEPEQAIALVAALVDELLLGA